MKQRASKQRVAANIRKRRDSFGWTQEELAARMGCYRTFISQLETGHRSVGLDVLDRIACALKCEPGDLLKR